MSQQAREFARGWKHHWYGFWAHEGEATGRGFSLDDHIDLSWTPPDLQELVSYLKSCPIAVTAQQAPAKCGFCDELLHVSTYRSDGILAWSDSLAHLVEMHAFVLPDFWVDQIRRANYVAPSELTVPAERLPWPATS
jgi:hypothetical protein